MKKSTAQVGPVLGKLPTGIAGLDEILRGGLPRERNTLLLGGPGSGKTVLALQMLVNGARTFSEPGIFVAFEETPRQIIANASSFGWNLDALRRKNLFFLDARLAPDTVTAGHFDLSALLAILAAKAREMGARRIVFDAVDVLLTLLDDPVAERKELFRLHHWVLESGLSGIITAKADGADPAAAARAANLQFMSDCVITLAHDFSNRVSLRSLSVLKYRGSAFSENSVPMSIGAGGVELSASLRIEPRAPVTKRRVTSGVKRLDEMLGGGYFRGASVLVSGAPGTAKSTLAAAFAEATCRRGESAVYVSFDESAAELTRNFSSVGIDLQPHLDSGRLRMHCVLADGCSAKEHYAAIQDLLTKHRPAALVIDPLTALIKSGGPLIAQNIAERIMRLAKSLGVTVVNTSLLALAGGEGEATPIEVSTIADTWIHLSYVINAGERNRALTIVKSRGTRHSNQVRELLLSNQGVTLADVYPSGGEVLLGTMRWQKEEADRAAEEAGARENEHRRRGLELEREALAARLQLLGRELALKQLEVDALAKTEDRRREAHAVRTKALRRQRGGDE